MSQPRSLIPRPGPARLALVLLAVVPAALAYPWPTTGDRWVLGVAAVLAIALLGWWQGLHFTTILRRRFAMSRSHRGVHTDRRSAPDARATALLKVTSPAGGPDALPVPVIADYLDRYGLHADTVRITSRDSRTEAGATVRDTWIGLTYSAAANLAALQARSASIPLLSTAEVAARRLADHLREIGWDATLATADDVPDLFGATGRETWNGVADGSVKSAGHLAAYRVDGALSDTFERIRSAGAPEAWTALEVAETAGQRTVATACALRTGSAPDGTAPLAGLIAQQGNHRTALLALHPLSGRRLEGHEALPAGELAAVRWTVAPQPAAAR